MKFPKKKTFGADADATTQDMVSKAKRGEGTLSFKPKGQFTLPKTEKLPPATKVNAVLKAQEARDMGESAGPLKGFRKPKK